MAIHKDLKSLFNQIQKDTVKAMNEDIMPHIEEQHKEQIDESVNQTYSPVEYERTGQLQESVSHTDAELKGDTISANTYYDNTKANHYSIVTGEHVDAEELAYWIEHGLVHNLWGDDENKPYLNPRPIVEPLKDKVRQTLKTDVEKALKKRGYDVK